MSFAPNRRTAAVMAAAAFAVIALGAGLWATRAAGAAPAPAPAVASRPPVKVFVNGADMLSLSGIRGRTFTGATVTFDAMGDVHLTLPDVAVSGGAKPATTAAPATAASVPRTGTGIVAGSHTLSPEVAAIPLRFYLVTEVPRPGVVGFDIEVWVNDAYIGMIKNDSGPIAVDVHPSMKAVGKNTLRFKATKRPDSEWRSRSDADYVKIVLTEGRLVGGAVIPDTRLFEFKKTAADIASTTTEHVIEIKR